MSPFEELHPALRYHVVNALGWTELRPTQIAAIKPVQSGDTVLLVAPTAGGKTEAAVLPVLSRMATEGWRGLSALYVCPLCVLLNNLEPRLQRYASFVGRRAALWHGDVGDAARRRILRDPPDLLLTTPESLEAMMISPRVDDTGLLGGVRVVVVDELHAFAGDDRGWHLLFLLGRIERLAGHYLQRLGLTATVGNPEDAGLARPWARRPRDRPRPAADRQQLFELFAAKPQAAPGCSVASGAGLRRKPLSRRTGDRAVACRRSPHLRLSRLTLAGRAPCSRGCLCRRAGLRHRGHQHLGARHRCR